MELWVSYILELRFDSRKDLKLKWCPKDHNMSKMILWFLTEQQKFFGAKDYFPKIIFMWYFSGKNKASWNFYIDINCWKVI